MKKIELAGSHYKIGLTLGNILKREHGYPKYPEEVLEKSRAYEEQLRVYAPGLLDEFQGIADSMGIWKVHKPLAKKPILFTETRFGDLGLWSLL